MSKITKTYSIDQKIYETFDQIADQKNINKSSFIESCIYKYINDNELTTQGKLYKSKYDKNHFVTVSNEDSNFYYLSDGSKIGKNLFEQTFELV